MSADRTYGRRDFFKDSVISVAKAAHEFVKHKDAPREQAPPAVRTDWLGRSSIAPDELPRAFGLQVPARDGLL